MNGLLSFQQVLPYFFRGIIMLLAIPVHESAHAFVSMLLGDDTAKRMGRLSLNPLAHFDAMGAVCMIFAGIGWAKPVPISANRFKSPKWGMALSSLAGPVSNGLLAFAGLLLHCFLALHMSGYGSNWMYIFISQFILLNINLMVFNLLPIPPWDGSRIAFCFLPPKLYFGVMKYERYIFIGSFILLIMGFFDGVLAAANGFVLNKMLVAAYNLIV